MPVVGHLKGTLQRHCLVHRLDIHDAAAIGVAADRILEVVIEHDLVVRVAMPGLDSARSYRLDSLQHHHDLHLGISEEVDDRAPVPLAARLP